MLSRSITMATIARTAVPVTDGLAIVAIVIERVGDAVVFNRGKEHLSPKSKPAPTEHLIDALATDAEHLTDLFKAIPRLIQGVHAGGLLFFSWLCHEGSLSQSLTPAKATA